MLNRKRNFKTRIYLDKILRTHQNYKFFNQNVDFLFKRHLNYVGSNIEAAIEDDQFKTIHLEFLRSQQMLDCSVCSRKVKIDFMESQIPIRLKIAQLFVENVCMVVI